MKQERRRAMRSYKLVLVLGVTLLVGLFAMFVGCGSDNDKSTGNTANYNDPEFVVMQGEVNGFVDSTLEFFTNGLSNIYGLATDTVVDPVQYAPGPIDTITDSISATYAGGWHVVYIGFNRSSFYSVLRDSIQFLKDGQPQQTASDLDNLLYRHFWTYDVIDTAVTHQSFVGNARYSFAGLNTTQATITGTDDWQAHSKYVCPDSTVWWDVNIDAALTDIVVKKSGIGWVESCPSCGSVSATIQTVYKKDTDFPDTTSWAVNLTFSDGNLYSVVTRGTSTWTYNRQLCTPPSY